jgi:hypothetical protein
MGIGTLRLTEELFWRLTLRQLYALVDRHTQAREHLELLAGIVASVAANFGFNRPKEAFKPADFMPSQRGRNHAVSDEQAAVDLSFFAAMARARTVAAKRSGKGVSSGAR